MKLQEAPSSINKVVKFPSSVTSYLKSEDGFDGRFYELNGGLLQDTHYAWLSCGPNFKVIRTSNGAKVAAWTFGAVLRDFKTRVTCVTELPSNDGSGRVSQFVVGLECELMGGMICVFDIRGSRVLRAIQMPSKVECMSVVDCGTGCCSPFPQILSSMTGVLAVGLAGGQVLLLDLCRCSYDEGIGTLPNSELRDELHACQLLLVNIRETDPEMLELKRTHTARTGDHLCVVLNECFLSDKMFLLPLSKGEQVSVSRQRVDITALMYVPRIASIVVGFNFGGFQIWNLMNLSLDYMSPAMNDPIPLVSFGFQEPCDDPRNFCYLWAVHSNGSSHRQQIPFAVMYALDYENKEWVDGYGYLNQEFVSCTHQFDFDMDGDNSGTTKIGGCSIACHTINKVSPGAAAAKRDNPRADLDESVQESDLTLCQFVWETWGVNSPSSSQMALFDLNQWYKEQMPSKIVKDHASTYMTIFSLDDVVEGTLNPENPLLDVRIDPASISQFTAVQSLEEHFYPSALSFESISLLGEELVVVNHPGVQRDILSQLEQSGPSALLYPNKLFNHCIAIGLKPMYTDITFINCLVTEQREFLLSVALEYQLVGFLSRCASEWMDGSQSALGCTLAGVLKWGWQRATTLKTHADSLCIPLFDYSGEKLDTNSYQLLHYCGNQMHHLTTLFQGVLKLCKNPHVKGVGDVSEQARVLELVAVYIEVVEWFVNVGLLPEFPCTDFTLDNEYDDVMQHRVPYPAAALANIYKNRREELNRLSRSAADKTDILFIDGLVKRECNGDRLSSLWERDGGSGLYPPPSIQSLLRIYLLDGIPMHVKHCIVIYVFLDLAGLLESQRYADTINQFIKFPSAFRLTPSFIKITQALWLLDHQDFMEAIDMLLDPLVSMNDLKPWQHQCIIRAFLYQGQHQMALKYVRVQQPPLKDIEDIRLNLTVLLVNGLIHEAFQYQRQHCNEQNSKDLLQHFFSACQQMNQLSVVLQLALSPSEEEAFSQFLQSCQNPRADDMRVMYYLERSRIAEAMEVNDSIRNSRSHTEMSCLKRSRSDDKPTCVRDTIVQAYANTLPSVTRKLAQYCAQEKLKSFTWKQVSRPTPMSVAVHRGELQPVRYRSSLIQATLEKARETWSHLVHPPSSPCTPGKRDRASMEKSSVEMTPFLCTPRGASQTPGIQRDITDVVFPTLMYPSPKTDDEVLGGSPVKRFRYSEHYPTSLGSNTPSQRKRLDRYSSVDALSLLQTPHVRRRTLSTSRQQQNDTPGTTMFTPHSILKVRKMVRRSASPDNVSHVSQLSFTSTSSTPDLPAEEEEEEQTDERMQVSDEIPTNRQIRFSFPMVQEEKRKSITPDAENITAPVTRSATKRSMLGGTPRKPLTRTYRSSGVRFGTSTPERSTDRAYINSEKSISWTVKERETKSSKDDDNESSSMENDSDAFQSLENSGSGLLDNVESPMKKQRVDKSDKNVVKTSKIVEKYTHHNKVEETEEKRVVKETYTSFKTTKTTKRVESTMQNDAEDVHTSSKKTESQKTLLVEETSQHDKLFDKNSKEEDAGELDTSGKPKDKLEFMVSDIKETTAGILLDNSSYQGSSFDMSYENVADGPEDQETSTVEVHDSEALEISANDKEYKNEHSETVEADKEPMSLSKKREGILTDDTTYHGSSFEMSCEKSTVEVHDSEALEISANDKEYKNEHSETVEADKEPMSLSEKREGILPDDTTYHGSSFEMSCEDSAEETEEKEIPPGEEITDETCKLQEESAHVEEVDAEPYNEEVFADILVSQEVTNNGDEQGDVPLFASYSNGSYDIEESVGLPPLIIESVTDNAEVELNSEEDRDYAILQSAAVIMSKEGYGEKDSEEEELEEEDEDDSEEEMGEDEEEEELEARTLKSQSDDEVSVVVLDSDSEDVKTKPVVGASLATQGSDREESEEEEQDEEGEEEEEEEEGENGLVDGEEDEDDDEENELVDEEEEDDETDSEVEHKSDDRVKLHNASDKEVADEVESKVVENKVPGYKFSTCDDDDDEEEEEETNPESGSTSGEDTEYEGKSKVESAITNDDNVPKSVIIEEFDTSDDSATNQHEYITFEDCEDSRSGDEVPVQNVKIEEPDTLGNTPCRSDGIVTIEEVCTEHENWQNKQSADNENITGTVSVEDAKSDQIIKEVQEVNISVDLNDKLKSRDPPVLTGDNIKEKMDFEDCISFNEISRSGHSEFRECQISQAMDVDKDDDMDFETEITANQISKPKVMDEFYKSNDAINLNAENGDPQPHVDSSETMEVQEMVGKTYDTKTQAKDFGSEINTSLPLKSRYRKSRSRSGSVPPRSTTLDQSKVSRSMRGTSAPPENVSIVISDSNKRSEELTINSESVDLLGEGDSVDKICVTDIRAEDVNKSHLHIIEEEPHPLKLGEKNETDIRFRKMSQTRAGSLPPIESHRKKIYKSRRSSSLQPEDSTNLKSECIPQDHEKINVHKPGSVQSEDIPAVNRERKIHEAENRARSVRPEDTEERVLETGNRTGSFQSEDIPVQDRERKICISESLVESVQPENMERKIHKSGHRTESIQPEDVLAEDRERKICNSGSMIESIPPEDIVTKVLKPGSRAGSVQPEDIPGEDRERQVFKPRSKVGSIQLEDTPAEKREIQIHEPERRDASCQVDIVPVVRIEKKIQKTKNRARSLPPEYISMLDMEKKSQKTESRARSTPPEDISAVDTKNRPQEAGLISPEGVAVIDKEKKTKKVGSILPDFPLKGMKKKTRKPGSRGGSVPPELTSEEDTEKKFHKTGNRAGSLPPEAISVITKENVHKTRNKAGTGSVSPENAALVDTKKKTKKDISTQPEEISSVYVEMKPQKSTLVPPDVSGIDMEKKSQKAESVPPEDAVILEVKRRTRRSVSRGSVQQEVCEDAVVIDREKKAGSLSPKGNLVLDMERKHQKSGSIAGSDVAENFHAIEMEKRTQRSTSREGSVQRDLAEDPPDRPSSRTSTVCHEDVIVSDIAMKRDRRASSVSSQASTVHLKPSRRSSVSSQGSSEQEDVTESQHSGRDHPVLHDVGLDIVYEEPEDVESGNVSVRESVVVKNRGRSCDFDLRLPTNVRRTRSESGSVHSLQTKYPLRRTTSELGSVKEQNVKILRSGKVISESEDDVSIPKSGTRRRARADSTSGRDADNSHQVMEEYATARRLTRYQRSLLVRSLGLTKSSAQSRRSYRLPALPETSDDDDDECETLSVGTRASSHPSASRAPAPENSSPGTSQASTVQIVTSDNSPPKTPRRSRRSSRLNDSITDSPSSVKSDASTVYASSVTSLTSPTSTRSEDVIGSRMRRRSFQKAQQAFKSMSEKSFPIGKKMSSPTDSDISSETSSGIFTRSAVARLSKLREEEIKPESSFQFSTPTAVPGADKKEAPSLPVPAFVFSPPQKQQPHLKLQRSHAKSQKTPRTHIMALRGLHTITEESSTSSPTAASSSGQQQCSERDTTPIAVKRSKRFKSTPKASSTRISIMTPLNDQEKRELAERERESRQRRQSADIRRYSAFKQRKVMRLLKSKSSKSRP